MQTFTHSVGGEECRIYFPEDGRDLGGFLRFLCEPGPVAVDTETTGLGIFEPGYRVRLVQFGTRREAWVLQADRFADVIRDALACPHTWLMHNAPFDWLVLAHTLGVPLRPLAEATIDTRTLAHLMDPRQESEGGAGLSLKPLSAIFVDPDAPDTQKGLTKEFNRLGFTKETGWAGIPADNELYVRYAGLDVILTRRLYDEIGPLVDGLQLQHLVTFEHRLARILAEMQHRGLRLDVPYTQGLVGDLTAESERFAQVAARYGVANPNSTAQVADALAGMGELLTEKTPAGKAKVDKAVLLPLADLDMQWERIGARTPNRLADAVLRTKRAAKWREAYAQAFLDMRDGQDRIHPMIGGLQARTARMSISRPPLQQLPSGDATVRRAVVADEGQMIISADYDQVEMRVLAALAGVRQMKHAIATGTDLHDYTAALVFGPDFTKFQRKLAKGVGFGKVYGGGAATLSRQTGATVEQAKAATQEYDRVYPEIRRYAAQLQRAARFGKREVVTPSGRHLPLDKDRLYSATNYVVQSTARDVMAQAIVDMDAAGLGGHLLLPIHDEILAQAPADEADEVAAEIGRIMTRNFHGVPLTAAGEVTGRNWGAAYGADPQGGIW